MAVMLIAKFDGDVEQLRQAYDRAHALIMSSGGATGAGELRHHCAIGEEALYIIGAHQRLPKSPSLSCTPRNHRCEGTASRVTTAAITYQ